MAETRVHRLTLLMIQRDITNRELADMAGLSLPTISYARMGRNVTISTLDKISSALKVELRDIIGYTTFDFDAYYAAQDAKNATNVK